MLTFRTEENVNLCIIENTILPLRASGEDHLRKEREKNRYIRDSFQAVAIAL